MINVLRKKNTHKYLKTCPKIKNIKNVEFSAIKISIYLKFPNNETEFENIQGITIQRNNTSSLIDSLKKI